MKKRIIILGLILAIFIGIVLADTAQMTVNVGSAGPTVDSVVVNDATPTVASTTEITVTTQVTDTNGVDDIKYVYAEFTAGSPANGNNLTNMKRSICTNIDSDTVQCIATYNMQFYDSNMTYTIQVYAKDVGGSSHTLTDNFDYAALISLDLDLATIAFGSMSVGQTKEILGDLTWNSGTTTIKNQGNVLIDAQIYATDFAGSSDSFSVAQAMSQFRTIGYSSLGNNPGRIERDLNMNPAVNSLADIDVKLTIPGGALPESYTSTLTVVAVENEDPSP